MCALFGGQRDMSLFRTLNKELINDIIDTEVYYYKIILDETKVNMYGEGKNKSYYAPIKVPCIIERSDNSAVEKNIYAEIGDVIEWDNEQHIVDVVVENEYFAGKNPSTWDGGDTQGYNVAIELTTHVAKKSQLKIRDDFRVGINKDNNDLPVGI